MSSPRLALAIDTYRALPAELRNTCPYPESCSAYGLRVAQTRPLPMAVVLMTARLLCCSRLNPRWWRWRQHAVAVSK